MPSQQTALTSGNNEIDWVPVLFVPWSSLIPCHHRIRWNTAPGKTTRKNGLVRHSGQSFSLASRYQAETETCNHRQKQRL